MTSHSAKPLAIITYSIAGLGHLRVATALSQAAPPELDSLVLSSGDSWLSAGHGIMSNSRLLRTVFEFMQYGIPEKIVTILIKHYVRLFSSQAKNQIISIVKSQPSFPSELILVGTHFMLTEQLSFQKQDLSRKLGIPVKIYLQVTDDTIQPIWYIRGVDRMIVPSPHVADSFKTYADNHHLPLIPISICPYPVSPRLTETLTPKNIAHRTSEYTSSTSLEIAIPLSGATVGADFLAQLASQLPAGFHSTFIAKTSSSLASIKSLTSHNPQVSLIETDTSSATINAYEQYYQDHVVGAEITKPSEQAFKVLAPHSRVGGSILFFVHPVGRQEYENLTFLTRYHFIPTSVEHQTLYHLAATHGELSTSLLQEASNWRGLQLPSDSREAANFIVWSRESGLLTAMGDTLPREPELQPDGAARFWQAVLTSQE